MAYTDIDKPTDYFNTVLYTGNNTYPRTIDGFGFQPDFVWVKPRSVAYGHMLFDVIRGVGNTHFLDTRLTDPEGTSSVNANIDSFDSDGYIIDSPSSTDTQNASGLTVASWGWKAGGTGASNTDGSITSTVSANTTSGFSIVSYTGTGANATVGHGIDTPKMVIIKDRDASTDWAIYHGSLGATKFIELNTTLASQTNSTAWNDTEPTSSVFSIGTGAIVNTSSRKYIAYCFAEKKGFSKFGSYTGNGSTDGPFVYLGFKPAFVITKRTNTTGNWHMYDAVRDIDNEVEKRLYPNVNNAELTSDFADFTSNGFKLRSTGSDTNASGSTYIYMCFAENPFVTSTGIPGLAR